MRAHPRTTVRARSGIRERGRGHGRVFAVFGMLSLLFFKQFGVGLATAIVIDATVVRAILLPATMKLLGEWNWYLPSWLRWLPTLERDESEYERETGRAPVSA